jgi:hypothetical protein
VPVPDGGARSSRMFAGGTGLRAGRTREQPAHAGSPSTSTSTSTVPVNSKRGWSGGRRGGPVRSPTGGGLGMDHLSEPGAAPVRGGPSDPVGPASVPAESYRAASHGSGTRSVCRRAGLSPILGAAGTEAGSTGTEAGPTGVRPARRPVRPARRPVLPGFDRHGPGARLDLYLDLDLDLGGYLHVWGPRRVALGGAWPGHPGRCATPAGTTPDSVQQVPGPLRAGIRGNAAFRRRTGWRTADLRPTCCTESGVAGGGVALAGG